MIRIIIKYSFLFGKRKKVNLKRGIIKFIFAEARNEVISLNSGKKKQPRNGISKVD